jgi:hypothetical protein
MNELTPSAPDGAGPADQNVPPPEPQNENHQRAQALRRNAGQIFSHEQILAAMTQLVASLALGMIKPAVGNSIRAVLAEMLRSYERTGGQNDERQAVADEDVRKVLRENPSMLYMLEPFLTDGQLETVMQEEANDAPGQT